MPTEHISHLLLSIQCNAHRLLDSNSRPVALGLFLMTSMMNHNCVPNAAHHFLVRKGYRPRLLMRALSFINVGDEITYSYVPLYQSTSVRKKQLSDAYGFSCICNRCLGSNEDAASIADIDDISVFALHCGFLTDVDLDSDPSEALRRDSHQSHESLISSPQNFECVSREINVCASLFSNNKSSNKVADNVLKKLRIVFSTPEKAGLIPPNNKILLNSYITAARAALVCAKHINDNENSSEDSPTNILLMSYKNTTLYFALLASGFIELYTHVPSLELAEMNMLIAQCLANNFNIKELFASTSPESEVSDSTSINRDSSNICSAHSFLQRVFSAISIDSMELVSSQFVFSSNNLVRLAQYRACAAVIQNVYVSDKDSIHLPFLNYAYKLALICKGTDLDIAEIISSLT
jgi:hypothetical protein